jgi:hypothetical protein
MARVLSRLATYPQTGIVLNFGLAYIVKEICSSLLADITDNL